MLPYQETYRYEGITPTPPVSKNRAQIMADLREIACEVNVSAGSPWKALVEYQQRMNAYMSQHGIVFYQP